jgi:coproporphyrinogen III oxidase
MEFGNRNSARLFKEIQDSICLALESCDGGAVFHEDLWQREEGGGGRTRIFRNGNVIEKGGVNFSEVQGKTSEALRKQMLTNADEFYATGVSIVLHPHNPHVPIIHMNIRHFALSDGSMWYGGGIDLTPHYVDVNQAVWFHNQLKQVCDKHNRSYYPRFSDWADDYFYIPHREETRGVGGIFFDDLGRHEGNAATYEGFVLDVGRAFAPIYTHLMNENRHKSFSDDQKQWQLLRRGRYVEFNLVHDRGTRFGLLSNGRTESILMSLPANASWEYDYMPNPGSSEAETLRLLKKGVHRAQ